MELDALLSESDVGLDCKSFEEKITALESVESHLSHFKIFVSSLIKLISPVSTLPSVVASYPNVVHLSHRRMDEAVLVRKFAAWCCGGLSRFH